MKKQDKRTLPSSALSMLPLMAALTSAARETPAQPPRLLRDRNEELALQLIRQIKLPYSNSLAGLRIEPPRPILAALREMAGIDAR